MIDLHTHSIASDGTDTPQELMAAAVAAGVTVLGLTDHDTTAGWAAVADSVPAGLTVVPGVELSCVTPTAYGRPIGTHLLGYLFDPAEPGFAAERSRLRAQRRTRAAEMVAAMVADGVPITWEQVDSLAGHGPVGRPHIGRALVAAGLAPSVTGAFVDYLHHAGPYFVPKADTGIARAIALIRGSGGVPVLAHPLARARGRTLDDDTIAGLVGAGLLGVEVDHPDHAAADRVHLRGLAAELGLLATGASDYHGTNKATPLAAARTDPDALEQLVALSTGSAVLTG